MARHRGHLESLLIGMADGAPKEFQAEDAASTEHFEMRMQKRPGTFVKWGRLHIPPSGFGSPRIRSDGNHRLPENEEISRLGDAGTVSERIGLFASIELRP